MWSYRERISLFECALNVVYRNFRYWITLGNIAHRARAVKRAICPFFFSPLSCRIPTVLLLFLLFFIFTPSGKLKRKKKQKITRRRCGKEEKSGYISTMSRLNWIIFSTGDIVQLHSVVQKVLNQYINRLHLRDNGGLFDLRYVALIILFFSFFILQRLFFFPFPYFILFFFFFLPVFSQSPRTGKMEDLFWVRHQKAENKRERENWKYYF